MGLADILAVLAAETDRTVLGVQVAVALGRKADVAAIAVAAADNPAAALAVDL